MTDKEKILAKIELLLNETNYEPYTDEVFSRINSLKELKSYIDSLQEEPVSEDLEEACEQLAENARKHKAETSSPFFSQTDYRQGVVDGAKWQKEKDKSVTKDLGDYINELSKQFPEVSFAKLSRIAVRVAKWKKQQMMKDAVVMEAHEEYGELWGDITKCSTEKGKKYKVIILKMEGLL